MSSIKNSQILKNKIEAFFIKIDQHVVKPY
ncbi:hypothetical protein BLKGLAD_73030 (plasmid) [Burkholderia gladioli pv. gladioli]